MRKRKLLIEKIALLFISIVVLIVLILTAGLVDPAVQLTDPGLEAALRDKLGRPRMPIHKSDLLTITELDASGREINNLQGIEYLRQLVNLNLEDNVVEDLAPLSSLKKLTELNLSNNEIADLEEVNFEAITSLPLRKLSLRHNVARPVPGEQIRLEDISLLQNMTLLEELELRYNHIEDITPLSNLTNLKMLDLRENLITDVSPLENLTALQELNLRENDLSCIAPLANLEGLLYLNIHSNENIGTIEPIAGLVNLQTLIIRNVPVGNQVTALRNLTNLQRLNIRNCSISDTAVIGYLMAEGALQDDPDIELYATLDIRDNPLYFDLQDHEAIIYKYWPNISYRLPYTLTPLNFKQELQELIIESVPNLFLELEENDLLELYTRNRHSNERMPALAQFDIGSSIIYHSEIRFRGGSARWLEKKSFSIKFESGQALLYGSPYMNANAMYTDPSLMREYLSYNMFHYLNLPAPRTQYIDMWINNVYEGLYLHVERIDDNMLIGNKLNPEGTLVRDQFRFNRLKELIESASALGFEISQVSVDERAIFLSENFDSRGNPSWDKLLELILWVEKAEPGPEFAVMFNKLINVEAFIDFLAIHYLIGCIDSFANDYWLYLDHYDSNARWIFIPWDKDLSFGSHWREDYGVANDFFHYQYPIGDGWYNKLIELFLNTDTLREKLDSRMSYLMENVFDLKYFETAVENTWQRIMPSLKIGENSTEAFSLHQQNHHSMQGIEIADLHKEALIDFVELRYAYLSRIINPIAGDAYKAEIDLAEYNLGDTILFTDAEGWTTAKIKLLSEIEIPSRVTLEVYKDDNIQGIDRVWRISNCVSEIKAEITLYYRNETESAFSRENWYTVGSEPVSDQWNLRMARKLDSGIDLITDSKVNPFSNKVVATVTICPEQPFEEFVIVFKN